MKLIKKRTFTGKENHSVTSAESIEFIRNYRAHYPDSASGCYADAGIIKALIDQPDAVGMRYYYTRDANNRKGLVLVGTDANRQDLLQGEPVKLAMFNPPFNTQGEYNRQQLNHSVALEDAVKFTATYRENATSEVKGGFFGKETLHALLAQKDCIGIHFLYGAKAEGTPVMVMVGVDKYGATMFFDYVMEKSYPCPPVCGDDNILNSNLFKKYIDNSEGVDDLVYLNAA